MTERFYAKTIRIEHLQVAPYEYELDRRELDALCAALDMPVEDANGVYRLAEELFRFQTVEKKDIKTTAQRAKNLRTIEKAAATLAHKMAALSITDSDALTASMPPSGLTFYSEITIYSSDTEITVQRDESKVRPRYGSGGRAGHILRECNALEAGAHQMHVELTPNGAAGGPRNLSARYVRIIADLARHYTPGGIVIGRGGDFERLCNAMFSAAKIPANAEGALRNYLRRKKAGYDWDSESF